MFRPALRVGLKVVRLPHWPDSLAEKLFVWYFWIVPVRAGLFPLYRAVRAPFLGGIHVERVARAGPGF